MKRKLAHNSAALPRQGPPSPSQLPCHSATVGMFETTMHMCLCPSTGVFSVLVGKETVEKLPAFLLRTKVRKQKKPPLQLGTKSQRKSLITLTNGFPISPQIPFRNLILCEENMVLKHLSLSKQRFSSVFFLVLKIMGWQEANFVPALLSLPLCEQLSLSNLCS